MKRAKNRTPRDAEYFSQMYEAVRHTFKPQRLRRLYFAWCAPVLKAEGCYWSRRIVDILTTKERGVTLCF